MADTDIFNIGVRVDPKSLTAMERDIIASYGKIASRLKPVGIKFNDTASQPLGKITGNVNEFNKSIDAASARVLAFSATVGVLGSVIKGFQALVRETIDVQKSLADINTVLNANQKSLDNFGNSLFDIARNTAQSFKAVSSAALEFSRQGLSIEETLKRTNAALVLSRISGLDAADAVKTLTTALNGFGKSAYDALEIVNKLANVDANFAVSSKDLSDALTRVGSTANEAGVSLEELLAITTSVQQTTSRGGAVIGNALKTIFTRVGREGTIEQLKALGVEINAAQGGIQKLQAIAQRLKEVDVQTANTIKELAGGVFQINVVTAALNDLGKEYSSYSNALRAANDSTASAILRNKALNETLDALASQAGTNIDELLAKIGKISLSDNLKTVFSSFNAITQGLSDTLDGEGLGAQVGEGILKGIGNFLTGPAALVAIGAFSKIVFRVGSDAATALKQFSGITTQADKIAAIQDAIGSRLERNAGYYLNELQTGKSIATVQQQILASVREEALLRAQIAKVMLPNNTSILKAEAARYDLSKGTLVPRGANGILPALIAEKRDVLAGVGGAPANATPVFVPRFNTGKGYTSVVANSSEKIIENFMGGAGSAILNQEMIEALGGESKLALYGKVNGVADGYVPSMATYNVAGGKVNLRRRGGDMILDEILAGFDKNGDRQSGTGIVRQAFDLAIEEGKKSGANNLIVDILNSKVAQSLNGNPKFASFGPFGIGKYKIPFSSFAGGLLPENAVKEAAGREVADLMNQGYSRSEAMNSLRVGSSKLLKSDTNPLGLGVFNTIQGQTDIGRAMADHAGQNLKTSGIPTFANPFDLAVQKLIKSLDTLANKFPAFDRFITGSVQSPKILGAAPNVPFLGQGVNFTGGGQGSKALVNKNLAIISNSDDNREILKASKAVLGVRNKVSSTETADAITAAFKQALGESQINKLGFNQNQLRTSGQAFANNGLTRQINNLISVAGRTTSPTIFAQSEKELGELEAVLAKSTFNKVKKNFQAAANKGQSGRNQTTALIQQLNEQGQAAIARRGLFSTQSGQDIFSSLNVSRLPQAEQDLLRKRLINDANSDRGQKFRSAAFPLAFAGSLAAPFIEQGAAAARENGNGVLAAGLGGGAAALQGASLLAAFGPLPAVVGAAAGALYGLADAMDQSDENAAKLTKELEELSAKNTTLVNGFSNYIQVQDKLNSIIESGGREKDINVLSQELSRVFASIADPAARKDIISTQGNLENLSEALAKAQKSSFEAQKRAEAGVLAAQSRDKATTLGFITNSAFDSTSIGGIAQSLVTSVDRKKLDDFAKSIAILGENINADDFGKTFEKIGLGAKEAKQLFDDLLTPINRLRLIKTIGEEIDISKELQTSLQKTIEFKVALTDLSRTLSTIVGIQTQTRKASLDEVSNRFSVGQNAAQNNAASRFFNAGEFARAQLSTAFEIQSAQFGANSQREQERINLSRDIASFVTSNRDQLKTAPDILKALSKEGGVAFTGTGNLEELAKQAFLLATGKGENNKVFAELASRLQESILVQRSIDDKEDTQIKIAQQNLSALRTRLAIENRAGLLGGAEGQIGFGTSGFDRFRNRNITSNLGTGAVGTFGRAETALGIVEFQKAFSNIEGFDINKLIPNAKELLQGSIRENLIQGFGRINVPITKDRLTEINRVSELSAAKTFEVKELTPENIAEAMAGTHADLAEKNGKAFGVALNDSSVAKSTGYVPQIYEFLKARFSLESDRAEKQIAIANARSREQSASQGISNAQSNIFQIERGRGQVIPTLGKSSGFFDEKAIQAVTEQLKGQFLSGERGRGSSIPTLNGTRESVEAAFVKTFLPANGSNSFKDTVSSVNKLLTSGDATASVRGGANLRDVLLNQLGQNGGLTDNKLNETGEKNLISLLKSAGAFSVQDNVSNRQIEESSKSIVEFTAQISEAKNQVEGLANIISGIDQQIAAQKVPSSSAASLIFGGNAAFPTSVTAGLGQLSGLGPVFASKPSIPGAEATDEQAREAQKNNEAAKAIQDKFVEEIDQLVKSLAVARDAAGKNSEDADLRANVRSLESSLLKIAQGQSLNKGIVNPNLANAGFGGDFKQLSLRAGENNAGASLDTIIAQANEAFISGFLKESDLKQIGIKIKQTLDEFVDAQIQLGVPEAEAIKAGERLRELIQNQLNKLEVKVPKNGFQEFGQGFSGRLNELGQQFQHFDGIAAQTADSLTDGFADAFYDIATGAKSAEDAVRGMLSSIAADLSKFFIKRAILTAITGNASYGSFANGGVVRRAGGGAVGGGVPALVMGGEYKFSPETVDAYGIDFFRDLNAGRVDTPKFAAGGMIKGGSGYKDDLFGYHEAGSFILQKSAVNKYGKNYLDSLTEGAAYKNGGNIQRAFWGALIGRILGGAVQGAVVGGATAAITGGDVKKGLILGGIGGGIAGGITGYNFAKTNPNAGFGSGFTSSFGWLGGGKNGNAQANANGFAGSGTAAGPSNADVANIKFEGKIPDAYMDASTKGLSLADVNGGNATGFGNNSLTIGQTMTRGSVLRNAGVNLGAGLLLAGASTLLVPKNGAQTGPSTVKGNGSVTTYNPDGSVIINNAGGTRTLKPGVDFNNSQQLEKAIKANGGNLPEGFNAPKFASGGVISGYGTATNRFFPRPISPFVNVGSGTKDDVNIKAKRGEFILNDKATDYYGDGLLRRMNGMDIDRDSIGGVLKFEKGGLVEYNESNRDRGMFSMDSAVTRAPAAPSGVAMSSNSFEINIYMENGSATVSRKSSGDSSESNSVDGQKFANKVKALFAEMVDQEKRPGGTLNKDSI